ncbi:MAG: hypothetical protein KKH12_10860 [Gammaproteobacteria bacterium]|nr:hypothetical protein [Gammaproteobacteria bacterium]MBU1482157.1 hypothetical protein [Gammaproteobacteria bacterium]
MSPPTPFRYTHLHNSRPLNDARSKPALTLNWNQCFFVGFRVATPSGELYHHAMIAADNEDAFYDGIAAEYNWITQRLNVKSHNHISVVFIRNLLMLDSEVVDSGKRQNIDQEIREAIERHEERSYIVYGFIGEDVNERMICLMEVISNNALTAIMTMQNLALEQHGEIFIPLEVCQSHPVTEEFDVLFKKSLEQANLGLVSHSAGSGFRH